MKEIKILATSDIHGFLIPWDFSKNRSISRGMSKLSTLLKNYNREKTILVDNGDMLQGNLLDLFNLDTPHPGTIVLNSMGYSVFNLGNHEFNISTPRLKNIMENFKGATLMANIYKDGSRFFSPYSILTREGIKIAFIGLNIPLITEFERVSGNLEGFVVTDPAEELDRCLMEIGDVDVVVGLFHMGMENENSVKNSGILDISKNSKYFNKLDIVIGGHVHKIQNTNIDNTLVTFPGKYARGFTEITLKFMEDKLVEKSAEFIEVGEEVLSDVEIENKLKFYRDRLLEYSEKIVGYSRCKESNKYVQTYESPLHRFLTEVMLHYSGADIVSFQIDRDDAYMPNGTVYRHNIMNNYSYSGGEISNYTITGAQLKDYMEWACGYFSGFDNIKNTVILNPARANRKYSTNDFFGNILYKVSLKNPVGSRIISLSYLNGENIKDTDTLIIGMNSYRMNKLIVELESFKKNPPVQISTTAHVDSRGFERGTIQELCEKYLLQLPNKTWVDKEKVHWEIAELN